MSTDVHNNTHEDHDYTTTGLNHRKMLMWAFLGSDCMFFGALIATYLVYQGKSLVGPYPIDVFDIPVTSVSTFVLLMSSMSMVLAYAALTQNKINGFRIWMASTAIMGATFIGFQVYEFSSFSTFHVDIESCAEQKVKYGKFDDYEAELCSNAKDDHVETHDGLKPQTNLFGTTFYTLTGFHGAHVTLGIVWILHRCRAILQFSGLWNLGVPRVPYRVAVARRAQLPASIGRTLKPLRIICVAHQ